MTEEKQNYIYYWLSLSGLTAKRLHRIIDAFSLDYLWDFFDKDAKLRQAFGVSFEKLQRYHSEELIGTMLMQLDEKGIKVLTPANPLYPERLNQPEVSPPLALYCYGNLQLLKYQAIGIVGTRSCTPYGVDCAAEYANVLSVSGVVIVSGLASGIDESAHKATLDSGRTIAVLGGGFKKITAYSVPLFNKIVAANGLIVSEYHPDFTPTKYTFPERNRIISALSQAIIVIEAGANSGALITADYAIEQNRDIYALPGNIKNAKSIGCNELIKRGEAQLTSSPNDILENLRITTQIDKKSSYISLDFNEEKLYNLLTDGQLNVNEMVEKSGLATIDVVTTATNLELKGLIKRVSGNYYKKI